MRRSLMLAFLAGSALFAAGSPDLLVAVRNGTRPRFRNSCAPVQT